MALAIAAALVVYSQTNAFAWDEGFHLLAARLILAGKQPYRDFLFAQTPLNAWWNSLIMRFTGIGWRVPQAAAALETAAGAWLTADYILRRLPVGGRVSIASATALLIAANVRVVEYATIPQAYGMCILLSAVAFRSAVASVEKHWWWAVFAGAAAGAAASSTLLAGMMGPVLFVWLAMQGGWRRAVAYAAGAAAGLSPVILALIHDYRQFFFDVATYHMKFRQVDWDGWFGHDLNVLTGFLDSVQGLILVSLVAAGAMVARGRRDLLLCASVLAFSSVYLATAHPTFAQYFVVEIPFAAVLAAAGLEELYERYPRRWPAGAVAALMILTAARAVAGEGDDMSWADLQPVADAVAKLTTPQTRLYADDPIYFLTGRMPPPGMEWGSGHKVDLPSVEACYFHVLTQAELDRQIKAGDFALLQTCDEDLVNRLGLDEIYGSKQTIGDCFVFREVKRAAAKPTLQ